MTRSKLPPRSESLSVEASRHYPGGYHDDDVEAFAVEDGQASVHSPSRFGENTHPHSIDVLNASCATNASLIAHHYRDDVQRTVDELELAIPKARSAEQAAHAALEDRRRAEVKTLQLRQRIEREGLELPSRWSAVWIILGIGLLFLGETGLMAASFQIFGLADRPAIPGIGLTDDLHITAYASVTALLVLGHVVGHSLRFIQHDLERRRQVTDDEARAMLPGVAWFHVVLAGVCLVMAFVALDALATVRVDYLRAQGTNVQSLPFLAIQVAIFAAAALLVYLRTHPHGHRWAAQLRDRSQSEKAWKTEETAFNGLVGSVNAKIDFLDTLLAQAGHHVGASGSDVGRQVSLYARQVILSQPEPTVARLLPAQLPRATTPVGEQLKAFLIGLSAVPAFEKLTTDALVKRQQEIAAELRDLDGSFDTSGFRSDNSAALAMNGVGPR